MSPQTETQPMSELGRITNVFLEPQRAFADIAARPRPWVPLALIVAVAVVFIFAFSRHVGWERFARQTMESSSQVQNLPAEQRERAVAMQTRIMPVMGYVGAVAAPPVMAAISALVLMLIFKAMSAGLGFQQMFAIVSYAYLPGILNSFAALAVMFLKNPDDFNLQNPTAFNAGAFLDPQGTAKWLLALCGSLDLFTFWTLLLIAVGVSVASRRITFGKALGGVVGPWLLWVALKTGLAALRG